MMFASHAVSHAPSSSLHRTLTTVTARAGDTVPGAAGFVASGLPPVRMRMRVGESAAGFGCDSRRRRSARVAACGGNVRCASILLRAKASDDDAEELPPAETINAMLKEDLGVDVEAIRSLIDADPEMREQERKVASQAREAASLQVDAQMAEEEAKLAREYGSKGAEAGEQFAVTQEAALADLEAKSAAVLAAEAKMKAIEEERAQLAAEAAGQGIDAAGSSRKWGSTVASDVDEAAEKIESAKAGTAAALSGTLLSLPLLLSQSSGSLVTLESVAGVAVSCLVFGVTYRYALRDDFGNDQLKGGVVGAFGLTRGFGCADVFLHGSDQYDFASWAQAALLAGESVLTFAFAAVALEAGFSRGLLQPFPMKKKV